MGAARLYLGRGSENHEEVFMKLLIIAAVLLSVLSVASGCATPTGREAGSYPARTDLGRGNIGVTDPALLAPF